MSPKTGAEIDVINSKMLATKRRKTPTLQITVSTRHTCVCDRSSYQ